MIYYRISEDHYLDHLDRAFATYLAAWDGLDIDPDGDGDAERPYTRAEWERSPYASDADCQYLEWIGGGRDD